MTTWYVRPDTSHSATRNGTSYATAWGGWSSVVWSSLGVKAGDTLYVCGTHGSSSQLNIGYHGSTANTRLVIRGDYAPDPGSLVFTGSAWLFINRDYTTIRNLTITAGTAYCIYLYGAPNTGTMIQGCTLNSKANMQIINLHGADNLAYVDLIIDDNNFNGGSGTNVGAAINWLAAATGVTARYVASPAITNNRFRGCSSNRAVIDLRVEDGTPDTCKITDAIVTGNQFFDCFGAAIEIFAGVYGRNTGIRLINNIIHNQNHLSGGMGGGMSIGGFGQSLQADFGPNIIARNEGYILRGPSGMINIFYGSYIVQNNYAEDISTSTIDGCGVLFDHGCDHCVAFGNEFRRLTGTGTDNYYSGGFGILVLDSTNTVAYGNLIDGCVIGVAFGNKDAGQSSNIFNNTFYNCSQSGAFVGGGAEIKNNLVLNNLFTATRGTIPSVKNNAATWTGEANNCFHGFGDASGHKLHATSNTADPQLDANYRPWSAALVRKGIYLGGKDFNGKSFYNPPNIGAVDDVTATPRQLLTRP